MRPHRVRCTVGCSKNGDGSAPFGVLVTLHDEIPELDPRIVGLPLSSLMLMR